MSRTARIKVYIVTAAVVIAGATTVVWHNTVAKPTVTVQRSSQQQVVRLSYHGQDGKTALTLLRSHASVQTKSSSLGDYVTSIDGNNGGGKKYWIFYVNGKESQVGAGAYKTHTSDTIEWKLQ